MEKLNPINTRMKTSMPLSNAKGNCRKCGNPLLKRPLKLGDVIIQVWDECSCVVYDRIARDNERRKFMEAEKIKSLFSMSALGPTFGECTFDKFIARKGSETAFKDCQQYANQFQVLRKKGEGLILVGPTGNGKSHLAAAIVNQLIPIGVSCIFRSIPHLLKELEWENRYSEKRRDMFKALTKVDLLVLDDVGAEAGKAEREEDFYYIIDERYRWKKPIIITANLELKTFKEKIGFRSFDRLVERCLILENSATSYRQELAARRLNGEG